MAPLHHAGRTLGFLLLALVAGCATASHEESIEERAQRRDAAPSVEREAFSRNESGPVVSNGIATDTAAPTALQDTATAPSATTASSAASASAQDPTAASLPADPPTDPAAAAAPVELTPAVKALDETPWERVSISAEFVWAIVDSGVRVGPSGLGVFIDLEDLLGMQSNMGVARLGGWWRFSENKRHRLDFSWMGMRRSADVTLGSDLDLGNGNILPLGTDVSSKFNMDLMRLTYSYSILMDDRVDLALRGGFYVAPMDFSLSVAGVGTAEESFKITAPLPVVGVRADFQLTERWYMRNSISLFYLQVGDFAGNIRELRSAFEYRATKWLALGCGLETFGLAMKAENDTEVPGVNFTGKIGFGYGGLVFYARGFF